MKSKKKPKVAFFALTSCSGCMMRTLDLEYELPQILKLVDYAYFHIVREDQEQGPYDITFVEGGVTTKAEVREIKRIRKESKYLVALGTCASFGGVPSIRDFGYQEEIMRYVYRDPSIFDNIEVTGIGQYVEVDYYMRGCPIEKQEFLKVLKYLLVGNIPRHVEYPVCFECRLNKNKCLLQEGKLCMGPITYGGCGAPCTTRNVPCFGCRGPLEDGNLESLVEIFRDMGVSKDDLKRMFIKFAGTSKKFRDLKVIQI